MADDNNTHLWIPKTQVYSVEQKFPGGGKTYKRDDYADHGRRLIHQLDTVQQQVLNKKDTSLSNEYILQIKIPTEVPIKQDKMKLNNLGFDILSYSSINENEATAKINKSEFNQLTAKVHNYAKTNSGKSNLAVLEEVTDVPLEQKLDEFEDTNNAEFDCIISLYNLLSNNEKEAILDSIYNNLKSGITEKVKKKTFLSGTSVIVARIDLATIKRIGSEYISIKSITKNRNAFIRKSYPTSQIPSSVSVTQPQTNSIVAIMDSGINDSSIAFSNLVVQSLRQYVPAGTVNLDMDHGTLVASRVIYGDEIDFLINSQQLTPHCKVIDIPVFGIDGAGNDLGPSEDDLIDILDDVVPKLADRVRVFNLSLGFDVPITKFGFTHLACELDFLSREFNVLFVVAAGNIRSPQAAHPNHFLYQSSWLQPPAEALLALSVGSIAKYSDSNCISSANEISAFSCRGPGADEGIKPEVVAHGGNLMTNWTPSPRHSAYGIYSSGSHLAYDVGTSFSAPIISQYAARLFNLYPNASVNLIKALLCHFTNPVSSPALNGIDSKDFSGFGEPQIDRALYVTSNSMAYMYEGEIKANVYQHIKFHIPNTLAAANATDSKLKIRVTLVYNPPINPDNHLEYSKSRISLGLLKNTSAGLVPVTSNDSDTKYNLPWNPIIHFEKDFTRSYLAGEWELRLRLMTRGNLPDEFVQNYAVVVEVLDTNNSTNVYFDIHNEFSGIYIPITLHRAA